MGSGMSLACVFQDVGCMVGSGMGSGLCRLVPGLAQCDFNALCLCSHAVRWGAGI